MSPTAQPRSSPDWPGRRRTLQYMRRHCSSLRKPRWHLQDDRAGCLASRASCLSRHSAATCSPSGDIAASAAHSSKPRYNASQRGSAEQTRWASTQSVGTWGKGMDAEDSNTPRRGQRWMEMLNKIQRTKELWSTSCMSAIGNRGNYVRRAWCWMLIYKLRSTWGQFETVFTTVIHLLRDNGIITGAFQFWSDSFWLDLKRKASRLTVNWQLWQLSLCIIRTHVGKSNLCDWQDLMRCFDDEWCVYQIYFLWCHKTSRGSNFIKILSL